MFPLVTIVIPFYNDPYIGESLASAVSQRYENVEIIVVDDGSTLHQQKIDPYRPFIHYIGKINGGTASALNYGIRMASGDYIAWLSSDDIFCPQKLERQMAFMQSTGSDISFTAFTLIDDKSCVTEPFVGVPLSGPTDFYRMLTHANPINGCTVVCKKEIFQRAGMFNEQLSYTQDYEMWLRLSLLGVRFNYLPEALTMYRIHTQMGTMRNRHAMQSEFESIRSRYKEPLERLIRQLEG